jgi:hypothetical protein
VTDRRVVPGCTRVRTKCTEKTSVGLWGQSRHPRELPGVTGPSHGLVGVLQVISLQIYTMEELAKELLGGKRR